jgi:hypothetical protein
MSLRVFESDLHSVMHMEGEGVMQASDERGGSECEWITYIRYIQKTIIL